MRGYIDSNDKKNEIRLLFRHPLYKNKVIVIVEGKSDINLFRGLLNTQHVKLESFDGKEPLLSAMIELNSEYENRIFAICDADYIHVEGEENNYEAHSVFLTDHHDAEIMLINSCALEMYIDEYSSSETIEFLKSSLFEIAMEAAYSIGLIRWLNYQEDLGLRFEGINFRSFVDIKQREISINEDDLVQEVLRVSTNLAHHVTADYLIDSIRRLRDENKCCLQINCGHDVTKIISMVYQKNWASQDTNMNQRKVESALRIGFRVDEFIQTQLFIKLNEAFKTSQIAESIC